MNTQVHLFILSIIVVLGGYFGYSEIKKIKDKILLLEKDKEKPSNSNNYTVPQNQLPQTDEHITNLDEIEKSNLNNLDLEYDNLEVNHPNMYNFAGYSMESREHIPSENSEPYSPTDNSLLEEPHKLNTKSDDSQLPEYSKDDISLDSDTDDNNKIVDNHQVTESIIDDITLDNQLVETIHDSYQLADTNSDDIILDNNQLTDTNSDDIILDNNQLVEINNYNSTLDNDNLLEETNTDSYQLEDSYSDDIALDNENHQLVESNTDSYQLEDNISDFELNSNSEEDPLNQLDNKIETKIASSKEGQSIVENYLDQTQSNYKEDLKKLYSKYSVKKLKEEFVKIGKSIPKGKKEILVDELINLTIK